MLPHDISPPNVRYASQNVKEIIIWPRRIQDFRKMPGMHVDMDGQRYCEMFYQVVIVFFSVGARPQDQGEMQYLFSLFFAL
jgi:hypothetical protein